MNCRFCSAPLTLSFVDLGMSPLSNAYLEQRNLCRLEPYYPLHAFVCSECFLVQLPKVEAPETIFSEYAYFSSYSESWLNHVQHYVETMVKRFSYNANHQVIEVASNDGYLLQYFKKYGIPVLGIEPAENVAKVAQESGIPTVVKFFGEQTANELAEKGCFADLLIGNNVLAHVPDLNDFVKGLKIMLKKDGIITLEFPHLMRLMDGNQFDTIYHEHFSYFSFFVVQKIFAKHGLRIFDVEELTTHGGSLRIFASHSENESRVATNRVSDMRNRDMEFGLNKIDTYSMFSEKVQTLKQNILTFLIETKKVGKTIVGYGAPAKGNTLLNYCGVRTDFIDYTVDRSPHKQNKYLPGTHIPIYHPDEIQNTKPDYVVILPWNLKQEIMKQMAFIRDWGGQFVTFIPEVKIYS